MKIKNFLILILAVAAVFCVAACGADRNDGEEKDDTQVAAGAYIVSVDTTKVAVDADSIGVCLYTLDGTLVKEKKLSNGKAEFEVESDRYVATLSGVAESNCKKQCLSRLLKFRLAGFQQRNLYWREYNVRLHRTAGNLSRL